MRKFWLGIIMILSIGCARLIAQVNNPSVLYVVVAPSGSCATYSLAEIVLGAGTLYTCQSGTWAQISGGGMVYPSGTGIAQVAGGTAWGATYNASNTIPANFVSLLNQSTAGNAATATALAATPSQCTSGQFATGVAASGNANCGTPSGAGTVTSFSSGNLSPLFTTSVATSTSTPSLSFALTNSAANTIYGNWTGSSAGPSFNAVPSCSSTGNVIQQTAGTGLTCHTIVAGDIPMLNQNTTGSAGSVLFSGIGAATNTNALLIGTGGSLGTSGSGTITATALPYSGLTGTVPIWNQNTAGTASNLSGTPALPNGTSATTQAIGDTSLTLATDQFVLQNAPFYLNVLTQYNASGTISTTTGAISSSTSALTVASFSGWNAGEGINIAGAGISGAALVTSISSCGVSTPGATCTSTAFTLAASAATTVSSATVNHDDGAALAAALSECMSTGVPMFIPSGSYRVSNTTLNMTTPCTIFGEGTAATEIVIAQNSNILNISYQIAGGTTVAPKSTSVHEIGFVQASGITPTGGYPIKVGAASGAGYYTTGLDLYLINCAGTWGCLDIETGTISDWYHDFYISGMVGPYAIYYNVAQPGGDQHVNDMELTGTNSCVGINQSDETNWVNLKVNGCLTAVKFLRGGSAAYVTFENPHIESTGSGNGGCGIDFGSGSNSPTDVEVWGGYIDLTQTALCNTSNQTSGIWAYQEHTTSANPSSVGTWVSNIGVSSLTTTGSSGVATLSGGVLNIPQYSGGGLTLQTNSTNNSSQTTLNLETSTANSAGITITPSNPSGGVEKLEATGTYSGTISSSQVTTGLGYTPANCTAGTTGSDCLTLSSGLVPSGTLQAHNIAVPLTCADISGSGTAQTCTTSPSFTPAANDCVIYTTTTPNSGTSLTLNVNSQGAKSIAKWEGATTLAQNDVLAGQAQEVCYNGTVWNLSTIGNAPSGGGTPTFPMTVAGSVTSGGIPYFNSTTQESSSALLTSNVLVKGGGAGGAPANSSITDNGTTISSSEPLSLGSTNCTTFGTAGAACMGEGTAPTNVSATTAIYPDSTAHEVFVATNGSTSFGELVRAQPSPIRLTGKTASISTATLCAASAGACNVSGTYHVHIAFYQSGSACSANTTNGVSFQLTWTDANGTAHSAQTVPLTTNASLVALTGTMAWGATTVNGWGSGDFNVDTNGTVIQYATTYANCTTGTATYAVSAIVTRLQ